MKRTLLLFLCCYFSISSFGQAVKTVIPHQQAWFGYFNQTRFSTHWGLWADVHHRRTDFLDRQSVNILRANVLPHR